MAYIKAFNQQLLHITAYQIAMEEASGLEYVSLVQSWTLTSPVLELRHEQMHSH
jgi:hypothetical protein